MRELSLQEHRDLCVKALMEIKNNGMSLQHIKLIKETHNYNEYLDRFLHDTSWKEYAYPDFLLTHDLWLTMKVVLTANVQTLDKEESDRL